MFCVGYLYIKQITQREPASGNIDSIPYYSHVPENVGIMFEVCSDEILFVLAFEEKTLNIIYPEKLKNGETDTFGHRKDYTVICDYGIVGYAVDFVGGIELTIDGETLRYTGEQIVEKLTYSNLSQEIKREIAQKIISGFSVCGFSEDIFLYITENCTTDLKFSNTLGWTDYITELCSFVRFVN